METSIAATMSISKERVIATPLLPKFRTSGWREPVCRSELPVGESRVNVSGSCCACPVPALRLEQTVTLALVAARSRRPSQPKAATVNRVRDYRALEREYTQGL